MTPRSIVRIRGALMRLAALVAIASAVGAGPMLSGCDAGPTGPGGSGGGCCKVCTSGKACGDSCIAKSSTCRKGSGCACNG